MSKDFNCTCNNCGNSFKPKANFIIADEANNVKITYFECPECHKKFFAGVSDAKYSGLLAKYRNRQAALRKALEKDSTRAVIQSLANKMNNYEKEILDPYYKKLREEWKNYF